MRPSPSGSPSREKTWRRGALRPPKPVGEGREGATKESDPEKSRRVTFQFEPGSEKVKAETSPRELDLLKKPRTEKRQWFRRGQPRPKKEKAGAGGAGSGR